LKLKEVFRSTAFLAIIACVLWATAFVGVKIGLKYSEPFQFAGIRFLLSGIMILPFIPNFGGVFSLVRKNILKILLVGFIQTFVQYSLFYKGLNLVPSALGAMVIGSGPLFIAVTAHIFLANDRITKQKTLSILLGLGGIIIISLGRNSMGEVGPYVGLGILILIANNILAGFGNILVSTDKQKIPPLILASFSMIFGGGLLLALGAIAEGIHIEPFPMEYYIALAWLSFLSAAAISIWYTLLKRPGVKVSDLNMWKFIIPVLGAVLSWAILPNESPKLVPVIGMALVASALLLLNLTAKRKGI
jgi:drug/metabolite transporter (DMT)-like permease